MIKKYLKIRFKAVIGFIIAISLFTFIGHDVIQYLEWNYLVKTIIADGGCPGYDGGQITTVYQTCIGDTPSGCPATPPGPCQSCNSSCPDISPKWYMYPQCTSHIDIAVDGYLSITELAPETGFEYIGASQPQANQYFIYCGTSEALPRKIGLSKEGATRIKRLNEMYDYIIASIKDKIN